MKINYSILARTIGSLLIMNAIFLTIPLGFSIYYKEEDLFAFVFALLINLGLGGSMLLYGKNQNIADINRKDGFLIVTTGWLALSIFGALPYVFSGTFDSQSDIIFETISGYTTTGATILTDIETQPKGILMWRSITQWIGGMGIIVLAVAILPFLGIGGMQLFMAEASGISYDKVQPRIKETAQRLWMVYIGLTVLLLLLLLFSEMDFYEALAHSFSTLSTGGFSPKAASIGHYQSKYIEYLLIVFMFVGGVNFTLIYFGLKGNLKRVWSNEEFRVYLYFVLVVIAIAAINLIIFQKYHPENAIRTSAFTVVALVTTTGFGTEDFTQWSPFLTMLFLFMFFAGASTGSTSGGIKVARHLLLGKNSILEFKRQLHPSAIIPVRLNGKSVPREVIQNVLAFIIIYLTAVVISTLLLSLDNIDVASAFSAAAAATGNVGPGIGMVGPSENFAFLSPFSKLVLSFCMLIGRLELVTVLIVFSPYFWQRN
jgi:trk system potassium uptake protein TrkH